MTHMCAWQHAAHTMHDACMHDPEPHARPDPQVDASIVRLAPSWHPMLQRIKQEALGKLGINEDMARHVEVCACVQSGRNCMGTASITPTNSVFRCIQVSSLFLFVFTFCLSAFLLRAGQGGAYPYLLYTH